jgi:hypothetical protein
MLDVKQKIDLGVVETKPNPMARKIQQS